MKPEGIAFGTFHVVDSKVKMWDTPPILRQVRLCNSKDRPI